MTAEPDVPLPEPGAADPSVPPADFVADTATRRVGGDLVAHLPDRWLNQWGVVTGGMAAGVAVRSLVQASELELPAAAAVEFFAPLAPGEVQIVHEELRSGARLQCRRARLIQDGHPALEATVWTARGGDAYEHDASRRPDCPPPDDLATVRDLLAEEGLPLAGLWDQVEVRPRPPWVPFLEPVTRPPVDGGWLRLVPPVGLSDPGVAAAALLTMVDVMSGIPIGYPHGHNAATSPHFPMTLSLTAQFAALVSPDPWVCVDVEATSATRGLATAEIRAWSLDERLMATATSQMVLRRPPTP